MIQVYLPLQRLYNHILMGMMDGKCKSDSELIQTLAISLAQRGWGAPAVMFLELLKPFSFICSQTMLLVEPLLSPLVGGQGRRYAALLEDRANIERLLEALEAKENK